MVKKPDVKRRKNLRLAMCVLFLLQVVVATMPFFQSINDKGELISQSPFGMLINFFSMFSMIVEMPAMMTASVLSLLIILLPLIGFFVCSFDKERNIKNIASLIICLAAVFILVMFPKENVSIGSVISLLLYIVISFITSMAMVLRLSDEGEEDEQNNKKVNFK